MKTEVCAQKLDEKSYSSTGVSRRQQRATDYRHLSWLTGKLKVPSRPIPGGEEEQRGEKGPNAEFELTEYLPESNFF